MWGKQIYFLGKQLSLYTVSGLGSPPDGDCNGSMELTVRAWPAPNCGAGGGKRIRRFLVPGQGTQESQCGQKKRKRHSIDNNEKILFILATQAFLDYPHQVFPMVQFP